MTDARRDDDAAHESRRDVVDSVKGKVKEAAGALTGNDDLAEAGRLEQAEVRIRRDAEADAIAADAQAEDATETLIVEHDKAENARQAVEDVTDANEAAAQNDRQAAHAAAEQDAIRLTGRAHQEAEAESIDRVEQADARLDAELSAADAAERQAIQDNLDAREQADELERAATAARNEAARNEAAKNDGGTA